MFVKVAQGPGLGSAHGAPRIVRSRGGAVIRMPLLVRGGRGVGSARGMGDALFTRPGADGGTQIVDAGGNTVYSSSYVAANPGIIAQLGAASGCANGTLPIWFPGKPAQGGGPVCGDPGAIVPGEGNSPMAQFEWPVNGQCNPNVWCRVGTNANDPNSYVWTGSGQPNVMNPAYVMSAGTPYLNPNPIVPGISVNRDPIPVVTPPSSYPILTATPPQPSSPQRPATAVISNTSRPGQSFQVGDGWKLVITGTPNQPVSGTASQNGQSLGTTPYGSTDSNGQLILTGAMDSSAVGSWSELWTVGTQSASVLTFSVSPAPTGGGSGGGAPLPAASDSSMSDFFSQSVDIGGVSIPVWGLIAAGAGALFFFGGRGR